MDAIEELQDAIHSIIQVSVSRQITPAQAVDRLWPFLSEAALREIVRGWAKSTIGKKPVPPDGEVRPLLVVVPDE